MEVQGCFAATRSRSSDLGMHLARVANRRGSKLSRLDTRSVPRLAVSGQPENPFAMAGPGSDIYHGAEK